MKRTFSLSLVTCLSFSLFAGCASSGADSDEANNGVVTIQYWHTQTEEERVAQLKSIIKTFETQNPNIRVEQVPVPEEDFPSRVSAALGADRLPAMIEGGIDQMLFLGSELVTDNALHEAVIDEIGKDTFYEGALNTMKAGGNQGYYGVPISGWVQGIWYNGKLFKEKGLEPPATWDNILKAAQAFHAPDRQQYGIVVGTSKDDFTEQTFSQFALSNEAQVFDQQGKVNFNSPEMLQALSYYKELAKYTPPGSESWREAREMYLSGRAPMVMYSSYLMGDLAENQELAENTHFVVPENKTKATYGEITSLAVMNTISEQEREAAKRFTLFLTQKDINIKYLHMSPGGANPTRAVIAEDPAYLENEVLQAYGPEAIKIASSLDNLKRFGFVNGSMKPAMGDISAQFVIGEAVNSITERNVGLETAAQNAQDKMSKIARRSTE
ncbi:ABC transporter substrate-binding protein [Paenibacillus xerothermodurans]|nr:ABC transporter substrate-binding protein [Paenibacillus xerothermodurans]